MASSFIENLLDPNNSDVIFLRNEKNEDVPFEQIAVVPIGDTNYIILKPLQPMEGVGEDEGLVFEINTDVEAFKLVVDEKIIDKVFAVYDELFEEQQDETDE